MAATIKTKKADKPNDLAQIFLNAKTPQLEAEFKNWDENTAWLMDNRVKLREKYADKFVAVVEKKVCFAEKNREELLKQTRAKYGDDQSVAIGFVPKEDQYWLL